MVYRDGVWADPVSMVAACRSHADGLLSPPHCLWKPPPLSRIQPIPLPPVTPSYDTRDHGEDDGMNYDGDDENYPGGGHHDHQHIQWLASGVVQEPGSSTGLAAADPSDGEDESQSEVSIFFTLLKVILPINGLDNS